MVDPDGTPEIPRLMTSELKTVLAFLSCADKLLSRQLINLFELHNEATRLKPTIPPALFYGARLQVRCTLRLVHFRNTGLYRKKVHMFIQDCDGKISLRGRTDANGKILYTMTSDDVDFDAFAGIIVTVYKDSIVKNQCLFGDYLGFVFVRPVSVFCHGLLLKKTLDIRLTVDSFVINL